LELQARTATLEPRLHGAPHTPLKLSFLRQHSDGLFMVTAQVRERFWSIANLVSARQIMFISFAIPSARMPRSSHRFVTTVGSKPMKNNEEQ
jgi:hypothetical protein